MGYKCLSGCSILESVTSEEANKCAKWEEHASPSKVVVYFPLIKTTTLQNKHASLIVRLSFQTYCKFVHESG